jgi:hypothetical protein
MQLRSANFSTAGVAPKCNPIIIALDRNWNEIYRAPLNQLDGMAGAVRNDYEAGHRGIRMNTTSIKVFAWATPN